ncbi:MAG: galactose-1-phosphate uridylyltransferase [Alphaproteobacteria bacterium]|nr:galactose-1-phosphate uridylyltransferase [Alphaproteobacteria bacterium]MDE2492492.1 galactose-1-phosphate uridylyltransferase [Alphaproteobacteria bacterium]
MSTSEMKPSTFVMPDGRLLHFYGACSGTPHWLAAGEPREKGFSHRRWHPVRREWVIYSAHRQTRTYKPATDACPLCPGSPNGEIPVKDFSIAVFDNRFSSFQKDCQKPAPLPDVDVLTDSAAGNCEVIVYSSDHKASMATLPQDRRELLVRVWGHRVRALLQMPAVQVVMPFENRGEEAGVTLHHPHGQIYAFPYLPPVIETMAQSFREGYDLANLTSSKAHEVAQTATMTAFVPPFARLPYETWISPRLFRSSPADLTPNEVADCARLLAIVAKKYDSFFARVCPYVMIVYTAPRGMENFFPFNIQFYPLLRSPQKLKYLAGCELGAGSFLADVLPETAARSLRNVFVEVVS